MPFRDPESGEARRDHLAELAAAVRELTEPRHHTEILERPIIEPGTGRRAAKRTRQRVRHHVTLPSLLDALTQALEPGATTDGAGVSGGFESRPAAELEPVAVLREITTDAMMYARALDVRRKGLKATLSGLVGATHTDAQLGNLANDARRWVRRARLATGFDPAPITLNDSCPYCGRKHALIITGDLQAARCGRCGVEWTEDTIGLLADMLAQNATVEVLALEPCWQDDCTRSGEHQEHQNASGRTWGDVCKLSDDDETMSA